MDPSSKLKLIFSHRPVLSLEPGVFNLHGHIYNSLAAELEARHINLCVEVRGYRAWRLGEIPTPYLPPAEPCFMGAGFHPQDTLDLHSDTNFLDHDVNKIFALFLG